MDTSFPLARRVVAAYLSAALLLSCAGGSVGDRGPSVSSADAPQPAPAAGARKAPVLDERHARAKRLLDKMKAPPERTSARDHKVDTDVKGLMRDLRHRIDEIDAAYRRLARKIEKHLRDGRYEEALRVLESDADYQRYGHNAQFRLLRESIESKRDAGPGH